MLRSLLAVLLAASVSAADVGSLVRDLGSDSPDARHAASTRLQAELARLEKAGESGALHALMDRLREARSAADPEAKSSANELLAPYLAGGAIWKRTGEQVPGAVLMLDELPQGLLVYGNSQDETKTWATLLDPTTGTPLWITKDPLPGPIKLGTNDGDLLIVSGWKHKQQKCWMASLDLKEGRKQWQRDLPGPLTCRDLLPEGVLAGGFVINPTIPGKHWISLLDRGDGHSLWECPLDLPEGWVLLWAGVVGTDLHAISLEKKGGAACLHRFDPKGVPVGQPLKPSLPGQTHLVRGTSAGLLAAGMNWICLYRPGALEPAWTAQFPGIPYALCIQEKAVICCGEEGSVRAYERETGRILWTWTEESGTASSIDDPRGILVADRLGCLRLLDPETGKPLAEASPMIPQRFKSSAVLPAGVALGGMEGKGGCPIPGAGGGGWLGLYRLKDADAK